MLEFALLLPVLLAPCAVAWAWLRRDRRRGIDASGVVEAMVVATTVQASIGLVLGVLGGWRPPVVLATHVGVCVIAGIVGRRGGPEVDAVASRRPRATTSSILAALVAIGAVFTWSAMALPTANFDSLAYHLPMLAHWVQHEGIVDLPHLGMHRFFAYGFEVLALPMAAVLRSDVAAALPNVGAWSLLGVGTFALSTALGVRTRVAMAAVVVLLTAPVTLGRLDAIQPDLWVGAAFVAALACLKHGGLRGDLTSIALGVLAAFLMPFMKPSGWIYLAIVGVAFVAWALPELRTEKASGRRRALAIATSVGLAIALFWYARNLQLAGNPLGDVQVRVLGVTVFDGVVTAAELQRTTLAACVRLGSGDDWSTLARMVQSMLGSPLWIFVVLGTSAAMIRWARRRGWPSSDAIVTLVLVVACLWAYAHMPYGADNGNRGYRLTDWSANAMRYAVPGWAMLVVLGGRGFPRGRLADATALGIALLSLLWGAVRVLELKATDAVALLAIAGAIGALLVRVRVPAWRTLTALAIATSLAMAVVLARAPRERAWDALYGPFFVDVAALVPEGATIAAYVLERPFPLMGRRFEHPLTGRVDPHGDRAQWQEDRSRWEQGTRAWLQELGEGGTHYLVVPTRDRFPERDGRAADATRLLADLPQWTLARAPMAPEHLALYRWSNGTGSTPR